MDNFLCVADVCFKGFWYISCYSLRKLTVSRDSALSGKYTVIAIIIGLVAVCLLSFLRPSIRFLFFFFSGHRFFGLFLVK